MSRRLLFGLALIFFSAVGVVVYAAQKSCPAVVSLQDCRVSIMKMEFPSEIQNGTVKMTEPNKEKYHFAVITLRVEKPAGHRLILPAADISLHYRRGSGDSFDVSPCEALSAFSTALNEDRRLDCFQGMGPGWVKSATGQTATAAKVVYLDAIFAKVERDVTDAWICIGQPGTPNFPTSGW